MHINCPSAQFKTFGELKNFKLSFVGYADTWKGSVATILETKDDSVWGVVWEISKEHEENLNKQENGYLALTVPIQTELQGILACKVYQSLKYKALGNDMPSYVYKAVCIAGAKEHGLPHHYIKRLESIIDNGYKGIVDIPIQFDS
ncbi:gamma-glutamylcyclotransferase [Nephila pilipes]|uniref:gamma-glutamylcyclotransferase n=1 Tax=Nephila pilipes TaxID=299642 RepID=A0A8X6QEX6_NEPPI|nr:gamma-glutamylcyclotransferase [Nephila pilipes]